MIDKLNQIHWSKLSHAFGEASDVPTLIENLCAKDKDVFESSIYELFGNIWHQGTIYEATPKALPFLIYIYENVEVIDKNSLLVLLASIAAGSGYHQIHSKETFKNPFTGEETNLPENLDNLLEAESAYVLETQVLCKPLLEMFISNLTNSEPSVRESVALALGKYPSKAAESIPKLEAVLLEEENEGVATHIRDAICQLKNA